MEKPDRGKATNLLHQILDTIAYKDKSDNVTLFNLYPLINNPMTQLIPKVFNSHLFVIFLELGLSFQSERSKSIGGAAKLLVWTDNLEKDIENQ